MYEWGAMKFHTSFSSQWSNMKVIKFEVPSSLLMAELYKNDNDIIQAILKNLYYFLPCFNTQEHNNNSINKYVLALAEKNYSYEYYLQDTWYCANYWRIENVEHIKFHNQSGKTA